MMSSLRIRLLTGVVTGVLLLLAGFSIVVYSVVRNSLLDQFDETLIATAHLLTATVELERDGDEPEMEFEARIDSLPQYQQVDGPGYFQIWNGQGETTAKSRSLGENDLPLFSGDLENPSFRQFTLSNGANVRAVGIEFMAPYERVDEHDEHEENEHKEVDTYLNDLSQSEMILVIASDASQLYSHIAFLRWLFLIATAVCICLSILVADVMVRRGLVPLGHFASDIAAIDEESLSGRMKTEHIPTELVPVADCLNALLERLESSFARERRFSSDVAHELRTPLAGIRSTLEVALQRPRDPDEYRLAALDCLDITMQMQSMVCDLLSLARLDAKLIEFDYQQVDINKLVNSCWKPLAEKAADRGISFSNDLPDDLTFRTDPDKLNIILSNLLGNAADYADTNGRIRAAVSTNDGFMTIAVSNTGCKLDDEQMSRVFDSFWRCDASRTDTGLHCGLGLALVKRLTKALGGTAQAKLDDSDTFTVSIVVPEAKRD